MFIKVSSQLYHYQHFKFIEKIYGCYRSGLDGGQDMRSFSGLHFLLQLLVCIAEAFAKARDYFQSLFLSGVLFSFFALIIALAKPYKKTYINVATPFLSF